MDTDTVSCSFYDTHIDVPSTALTLIETCSPMCPCIDGPSDLGLCDFLRLLDYAFLLPCIRFGWVFWLDLIEFLLVTRPPSLVRSPLSAPSDVAEHLQCIQAMNIVPHIRHVHNITEIQILPMLRTLNVLQLSEPSLARLGEKFLQIL